MPVISPTIWYKSGLSSSDGETGREGGRNENASLLILVELEKR